MKRATLRQLLVSLVIAVLFPMNGGELSLGTTPAAAQDKEKLAQHYKGKTITIVVGYGPGGGQDITSRLAAVHMRKYIPGNPRFIVQNITGADGLIALQFVMRKKPKGLYIAPVNLVLHQQAALGRRPHPGVNFDKAQFLGNFTAPSGSNFVCVRSEIATSIGEVIRVAKARGRPLNTGVFRAGSFGYLIPEILNLPFKPVPGYRGSGSILRAMDQGELEALIDACTTNQVQDGYQQWIEEKTVTPVINRNCVDPNTPHYKAFLKKGGWENPPCLQEVQKFTDHQTQVLKAWDKIQGLQTHVWMVHPDTPQFIVEGLRGYLKQLAADPVMKTDMNKRFRDTGWTPASEYRKWYNTMKSASGPLLKDLQRMAGVYVK